MAIYRLEYLRMWKAELNGNAQDIADLEQGLPSGGHFSISAVGDVRYLVGHDLEVETPHEALGLLQATLTLLNAAAGLSDRAHRSVSTNRIFDEYGCQTLFVNPEPATGWMRASTATVSGQGTDIETPVQRLRTWGELVLDLSHVPAVVEVCEILVGKMSIAEMYKIWEIANDPKGPLEKATNLALKAESSRFKHSANDPKVFGADARHARSQGKSPRKPMSIGEARAFIEEVVRVWIVQLAAQFSIPTETTD
jgi:hypothetical protein